MASYLDARAQQGEWLVRIEDVDETRTRPGAARHILSTLDQLGMHWDGEVAYQSQRKPLYHDVLETLLGTGDAYHCTCTRAEVTRAGRPGIDGPVYPGTCRAGAAPDRRARAIRLRSKPGIIAFADRIAGNQVQDVAEAVGDFVIRRADGYTAYQLAVVVDDQVQGVTDVVRGADLLVSTPRQIYLQRLLGYATPRYAHIPLVRDPAGRKLSKAAGDTAVTTADPLPQLLAAWHRLGQQLPGPLPANPDEFWTRAIAAWRIEAVETNHVTADTL